MFDQNRTAVYRIGPGMRRGSSISNGGAQ